MRQRTRARELALQLLYQIDLRKEEIDSLLSDFWEEAESGKELNPAVKDFANSLVKGTCENLQSIDTVISAHTENWQLDRMAVVDRNIMRMATFELLYMEDIPPKVAINEAVELAKRYGDIDSGKFVNGILDKVNKKERKDTSGKEG